MDPRCSGAQKESPWLSCTSSEPDVNAVIFAFFQHGQQQQQQQQVHRNSQEQKEKKEKEAERDEEKNEAEEKEDGMKCVTLSVTCADRYVWRTEPV